MNLCNWNWDKGHWIKDTGHWTKGTGQGTLDKRHWTLDNDTGQETLDMGHWTWDKWLFSIFYFLFIQEMKRESLDLLSQKKIPNSKNSGFYIRRWLVTERRRCTNLRPSRFHRDCDNRAYWDMGHWTWDTGQKTIFDFLLSIYREWDTGQETLDMGHWTWDKRLFSIFYLSRIMKRESLDLLSQKKSRIRRTQDFISRGGKIRTCDLLVPNQTR